jgi:hypothetical protein
MEQLGLRFVGDDQDANQGVGRSCRDLSGQGAQPSTGGAPAVSGRPGLDATSVEPDRPGVPRVDAEMGPVPPSAHERGADGVLRLSLGDEHHAVIVGEGPTQHDEVGLHETVHEERVRGSVRPRPPGRDCKRLVS